jgi:hypothetical protein
LTDKKQKEDAEKWENNKSEEKEKKIVPSTAKTDW